MEVTALVGIALALLAGYTYAIVRRSWTDHQGAKAGVRAASAKRWSDVGTAVLVLVLVLVFLRWTVGNL